MEMNRNLIRRIKADYPPGTRIELIFLDDPYAKLPPRLQGVVALVDDAGTIHTQWDNGATLGLVPGVDRFRKVEERAYKRRFTLNPLNLQDLRNTDHTDASRRVVIEKVVELDTEDFAYFAEHLREGFPFIHDNIPLMHMDPEHAHLPLHSS